MPQDQDCVNSKQNDTIVVNNTPRSNDGNVPPRERRRQVLEFIDEHDMPLPPLAIFAGMKRQYRATFSYRTVQNILGDLVEKDQLIRVDTTKLREGEIRQVEDGSSRRTYYFITDDGRERVDREKSKY